MTRRIAALYDVHGNLPALDAVLDEVARTEVDAVVVGGDVLPGPMPREALARLRALDVPVHWLLGNGELAVLAQLDASTPEAVRYWGTTSGAAPPAGVQEVLRWTANEVRDDAEWLRTWPATVRLEVDGFGPVLFCHGTPRSETESFTRLTSEALLAPVFASLDVATVVCGHTHMPFDRIIAGIRVINAGSVGMPFGTAGADWLLLGREVTPRHTSYDLAEAARRVRETAYPQAEAFAQGSIMAPPSEAAMLDALTGASFR